MLRRWLVVCGLSAMLACSGTVPPDPEAYEASRGAADDLSAPLPDPLPDIAARVNGHPILMRNVVIMAEGAASAPLPEEQRPVAYRQALKRLIVRELLLGPKRFTDLREALAGVSPSVLSDRLLRLEQRGVVSWRRLPAPSAARVYELTGIGRALEPVVLALARWGARFLAAPQPEVGLVPVLEGVQGIPLTLEDPPQVVVPLEPVRRSDVEEGPLEGALVELAGHHQQPAQVFRVALGAGAAHPALGHEDAAGVAVRAQHQPPGLPRQTHDLQNVPEAQVLETAHQAHASPSAGA